VGIDHVVFTVPDVAGVAAWWHEHFGVDVLRLDEWSRGEALFVSLRISDTTVIDLFAGEPTGVNVDHVSFCVDATVDLEALAASGRLIVDHPPFRIWGAQGYGLGMYVTDPVGNRIELKQYGGD
jgi:catechol 2,3-dioxygenase-like lactoylglutathione lyase family enzyme